MTTKTEKTTILQTTFSPFLSFISKELEVNIVQKLARNLGTSFKVCRENFLENPLQNLNRVTDFGQVKIVKVIEDISHSISYCKISLLIYSGSYSHPNPRPFCNHLVDVHKISFS